jgi:hypothetical protein
MKVPAVKHSPKAPPSGRRASAGRQTANASQPTAKQARQNTQTNKYRLRFSAIALCQSEVISG